MSFEPAAGQRGERRLLQRRAWPCRAAAAGGSPGTAAHARRPQAPAPLARAAPAEALQSHALAPEMRAPEAFATQARAMLGLPDSAPLAGTPPARVPWRLQRRQPA